MLYAFLAAVFYAVNIPASKVLLRDVGPTTMAALLVIAATVCWGFKDRPASDCPLSRGRCGYLDLTKNGCRRRSAPDSLGKKEYRS